MSSLNTKLDADQVLREVYVEAEEALKVTGSISVTPTPGGSTEAEQQVQTAVLQDIETNTSNTNTAIQAVETEIQNLNNKTASALVTEEHDFVEMTYVGLTNDIDTVTYKLGGSGGTTVATLTMGYDGNNRLQTITKS